MTDIFPIFVSDDPGNINMPNDSLNDSTDLSLNKSSDLFEPRNVAQTSIAVIFLLVTMVIALVGNTAVITVILMKRTMRKDISNLLIINLSITDLSMTIFVMVSALVSLIADEWIFDKVWCDFVCAINYCLIIVSMLTLCFISVDRYQAVLNPLHYHIRMTRNRVLIMICYSWCQGILFASIPSFMNWVEYDYWEAICAIQWFRHQSQAIYYVTAAFALCFLGPGIVLVYNYLKILKEAKKQKNQIRACPTGQSREKSKENAISTRIVWSLLVVVFAYFICTTPFSLTKLIKVIATRENFIPGPINLTASLLGYVASAINPLIYGIFRRDFRQAYKRLFQFVLHWRRESETPVFFFKDSESSPKLDTHHNITFNLTESCPTKSENDAKNNNLD